MPVTSFPFNSFPREIRDRIWTFALPAPRIVYLERHLKNKEEDRKPHHERQRSTVPYATYFSSPSTAGSITSLLRICKESQSAVQRSYMQIFHGTWFCFAKDYLYLDWGLRSSGTPYAPHNFLVHTDEGLYGPARILDEEWTTRINYLVVRGRRLADVQPGPGRDWGDELIVVRDILPVFSGLRTLVLVDQLFNDSDPVDELTWSFGEVGDDLEDTYVQVDQEFARSLIWAHYHKYIYDQEKFENHWQWAKEHPEDPEGWNGRNPQKPQILRKSLIPTTLKKQITSLCGGSEETMLRLWSFDWYSVVRLHGFVYDGDLDISQQIAYLDLIIGRICPTSLEEYPHEPWWYYRRAGGRVNDIQRLLSRRNKLAAIELGFRDLVISEAEETTGP